MPAAAVVPRISRRQALYLLLGFSAGLPFYMFSTVLTLRLQAHEIGLVVIGFFAWVQLLPTFKFLWAPLLDRYDVPGFGRFWGKRRGWIMLSQLGIFMSMVAMALTSSDDNLGRHRLVRGAARLLDDDAGGRRRRLAHRARADAGASRARSRPPICGATAPRWSRRAAARCSSPTSRGLGLDAGAYLAIATRRLPASPHPRR